MRAIGFMAVCAGGWGLLVGTEWLAVVGVERVWNSLPPVVEAAEWVLRVAGLVVSLF